MGARLGLFCDELSAFLDLGLLYMEALASLWIYPISAVISQDSNFSEKRKPSISVVTKR
jgi:hypothetical protein